MFIYSDTLFLMAVKNTFSVKRCLLHGMLLLTNVFSLSFSLSLYICVCNTYFIKADMFFKKMWRRRKKRVRRKIQDLGRKPQAFLTEMTGGLFPFFLSRGKSWYCSLARLPSSPLRELLCAGNPWSSGPVGLYAGMGLAFSDSPV